MPPTLPHKWDLADQVPEGLDAREILHQLSLEERTPSLHKEISQESLKIDHSISEQQKDQERIENILNYLKTELTVEKHFWFDEQQIHYFKNIAANDPQEALKKWQYAAWYGY